MQSPCIILSYIVSSIHISVLCQTHLALCHRSHVAPTARCPTDRHPRLQVVDQVRNQRDQDEEDQDDEEDDDVALHPVRRGP